MFNVLKRVIWAKTALLLLPLTVVLPALGNPVISNIPDVQLLEDIYCDGVGYTVTDPDVDDLMKLGVTVHSSNPDLIPDENMKVIRAGYSGLITLQPVDNAFGTALITATVTNPAGASASTVFTYTVVQVNDTPTLDSVADRVLTVDAGIHVVPLAGITSGASNEFQDLVVTAYAHPTGILTNLQINYTSPDPTGTLSFETVSNACGKVIVDVFVEDGGNINNVLGRSFTVQVNPTNIAPSILSIPDQLTEFETAKVIDFTIGDKETAAEDLALSVTSSNITLVPAASIIFGGTGSNRTATINPAAGQSGTTQIIIAVEDAGGARTERSFLFTVRPDLLMPVVASQPRSQTFEVGATGTLSVAAVGEEPFTYQWQHNGTDLSLQTNATLEITNVQTSDAGEYTAVVTNSKGSVTSFGAQVRVVPSPSFTQVQRSNKTMSLTFNTVTGLTYSVEYKNSLNDSNWNLLEVRAGTGGSVAVSDPGAKWASRFYRLRVE